MSRICELRNECQTSGMRSHWPLNPFSHLKLFLDGAAARAAANGFSTYSTAFAIYYARQRRSSAPKAAQCWVGPLISRMLQYCRSFDGTATALVCGFEDFTGIPGRRKYKGAHQVTSQNFSFLKQYDTR